MSKKQKPESNFVNMILTLLLIAIIAGMALGSVFVVTEEPIARAKEAKLKKALGKVLPEFDTVRVQQVKPLDGGDSLAFYSGFKDDQLVGTAIKSYSNKGYGGTVEIMIGFKPDMTINNTAVLKHKETPGLGDKMSKSKSDWSNQFIGKDPKEFQLKVKKDGGDVDAITAATITSRAFCDAARRAYETYEKGDDK